MPEEKWDKVKLHPERRVVFEKISDARAFNRKYFPDLEKKPATPAKRFFEKTIFHLSKNHGITLDEARKLVDAREYMYEIHRGQERLNREMYAKHTDRTAMIAALRLKANFNEVLISYLHDGIEQGKIRM
ncbi:MAG: hypothetical protein ABIG96_04700, partial [Candidatus Micrarchaeota archaeon]